MDSKFASEAHYIRQRMKLLFQHMEDKDLEASHHTLPPYDCPELFPATKLFFAANEPSHIYRVWRGILSDSSPESWFVAPRKSLWEMPASTSTRCRRSR